jgi:hypothetical protein
VGSGLMLAGVFSGKKEKACPTLAEQAFPEGEK